MDITKEAIEAAGTAILNTPADYPGDDRAREWAEYIARAALEAAFPIIAAEAWDEGRESGAAEYWDDHTPPNPYRSES